MIVLDIIYHKPPAMQPVSLIFTVLNESRGIGALLDSIAGLNRLPDEVVVCDGGSRDDTVAQLHAERRFPVRVIESPGANISRGRNVAIAAATHAVIACTDAGVRLHPDWLTRITAPFENPAVQVVSGFFLPDHDTVFETAMSATVLPAVHDISPETFLPSSRSVAFRKTAWQTAGGYPEWLDYCEDLVYDFALREKTGPFVFVPEARVYFRPRGSLRAFFKQYYLYARGDGKAGLWLKRHVARYATYLVGLPLLLTGMFAGSSALQAVCLGLLLAGAAVYLRDAYRRLPGLWGRLRPLERLQAVLLIPLIKVTGDVAKMLGYPIGLVWRVARRGQPDRHSAGHAGKR
jgi:glycosyltransferase involved in cell wall biosynthesis